MLFLLGVFQGEMAFLRGDAFGPPLEGFGGGFFGFGSFALKYRNRQGSFGGAGVVVGVYVGTAPPGRQPEGTQPRTTQKLG